jgi:allantoin racemase
MPTVALINPNTSTATTTTLVAIAERALGCRVRGCTARTGPPLIQDEAALRHAAHEVVAIARRLAGGPTPPDAIIVAAFGDPGVDDIRSAVSIPVVGIAEAAIREAACRRFGIVTTTPGLVAAMEARVTAVGARDSFTGVRVTPGDPRDLTADPDLLHDRLAAAARDCVTLDRAEAVIIGGGPLAAVAERLRTTLDAPVIAPVPAACRALSHALTGLAL